MSKLGQVALSAYHWQHNARLHWSNAFLRRQLARQTGYSYTTDYISPHTDNWLNWLKEWCGRPGARFLEIGSFQGRSAVWFLQNILTDSTATLDCLDRFHIMGTEPRFDHNLKVSGRAAQVTKHKGRSEDILPGLPQAHFDAIYVDGSHRALNVLMDAMLAWQRLKPGGVLFFDDYTWQMDQPATERPQMAIDLFLEAHHAALDVMHFDYQVAVRKRPASALE